MTSRESLLAKLRRLAGEPVDMDEPMGERGRTLTEALPEIIEAFSLLPELRGTIQDLIDHADAEGIVWDDTFKAARETLDAADRLLSKVSGQ